MEAKDCFGRPALCARFIAEHPKFVTNLASLYQTMNKVFVREGAGVEAADTLLFFMGRKCCEDFLEILLLAANGYGTGALKLLRSLFENAVTAAYLSSHPDEVERFLDFHIIHMHRLYDNLKKMVGEDAFKAAVPAEVIRINEEEYKRVKPIFQTTDCKKCGTKKLQQGWTKHGPEQLVQMVLGGYKSMYHESYLMPMLQLHTTAMSVMEQIKTVDGKLTIDFEKSMKLAEDALFGAHRLIVEVLTTQNNHFSLGLDEDLTMRLQEFVDSWPD